MSRCPMLMSYTTLPDEEGRCGTALLSGLFKDNQIGTFEAVFIELSSVEKISNTHKKIGNKKVTDLSFVSTRHDHPVEI